ncbi:EamA family transporter [Desulfovibrio mangrovi]|uniref:EamA family transporter n=1 Tax=Desulfovibrio mangrovi TaxID=2976983 RepID=UPI002245AE96|nr:EamA family transporter [Desulfovibrio mangrovi]UZP68159.1 EamA family transporter [Desulfovibrio mangrovi]
MKAADIFLAVLVALVWGVNFVVIKVGLGAFPPILFVALRFFFAAVPAVFFISRKGIPWRWLIAIGMTLGVVKFGLLFVGMNMGMPAGLSSLVLQCQAIFTLFMTALVLKDVPTKWQACGVAVACAGMGLLVSDMSGTPSFTGLMLVIAAGFFWGVSNILMKKVGKVDMLSLIVWMSLVPPLPLLGLSALMETGQWEAVTHMTLTGASVLFYIAIISTVFAFGIWAHLFKQYSPNMVAPFSLLVPIFGIVSASVVLGEEFTAVEMTASCLVLGGIFLVVFGNRIAERVGKLRAA